jgi:hypothetical protein
MVGGLVRVGATVRGRPVSGRTGSDPDTGTTWNRRQARLPVMGDVYGLQAWGFTST